MTRLLITGATGVAGSACVRQALLDTSVDAVTTISRKPLPRAHPKLTSIVHDDFLDYSAIMGHLRGHDAALWCLGISQTMVPKDEYERITFDYTLAGARAFMAANPELTFCHLSGAGADSNERSRILFSRTKGRTENALDKLGLKNLYHFRPAYIHPPVPRQHMKFFERAAGAAAPILFRVSPANIIRADDLAKAMIFVGKYGAPKRILEKQDIRNLVRATTPDLAAR